MKAFPSFAAAAAATGLSKQTAYWIAGMNTPGDAGQGMFVYSPSSTAEASNDTVVVASGGRLLRVTAAQATVIGQLAQAIGADLRSGGIPTAANQDTTNEWLATLGALIEELGQAVTSGGFDSAGNALPPGFEDLAEVYTYEGDNVKTITKTDGTSTWTKTFTYTGGKLTNVSQWVKP